MTCPHGEIHRAACLDCAEGPPPERPAPPKPEAEAWTTARLSGWCSCGCGTVIDPGDRIGVVDGAWMAEGCVR